MAQESAHKQALVGGLIGRLKTHAGLAHHHVEVRESKVVVHLLGNLCVLRIGVQRVSRLRLCNLQACGIVGHGGAVYKRGPELHEALQGLLGGGVHVVQQRGGVLIQRLVRVRCRIPVDSGAGLELAVHGDTDRLEQDDARVVLGNCRSFARAYKERVPVRMQSAVEAFKPGLRTRIVELAGPGQHLVIWVAAGRRL